MNERWKRIEGFEDYEVSDHGCIRRGRFLLAPSRTADGTLKINMSQNGVLTTRSLKTLVAEAFVPNQRPEIPMEVDIFGDRIVVPEQKPWTTPILLDGDPANCHYMNIMWRPRWFAWKYKRQFNEPVPRTYDIDVVNLTTGTTYYNVQQAGIEHGVLWRDIYHSILTGDFVFPTGHVYDAR